MTRVMASGVFDILHLGHVHYLKEAKKLGDELVVVVATDATVRKFKHEPITSQEMRRQMVESLKPVDRAVLGREGEDMYGIVNELKPDIIALGHDQTHDKERIEKDLKELGMEIKVVRLPPFDHDLNGTRKIIRKVVDWWQFKTRMEKIEGRGGGKE